MISHTTQLFFRSKNRKKWLINDWLQPLYIYIERERALYYTNDNKTDLAIFICTFNILLV